MSLSLRPVAVDDLADLQPLDAAYAREMGVEPAVEAASLGFFARTGHAFVAESDGRAQGAVFAQAVWDGVRPTVRVSRVIGSPEARRALAEAVVKSAYDAAVYDLVAEVPAADESLAALLSAARWSECPTRRFARVLGSRANPGSLASGGGA
ncbi:MAG: DUF1999 family protein [Trueperaceae bacterium]